MLSLALVSIIWELMYDRQDGLINSLIGNGRREHRRRLAG